MAAQSLRRIFLFPLILLVLVARPVSAQFSGAIQGTITDSQKAVVADAIVIVTHTASGVTREVDDVCRRRVSRPESRARRVSRAGRQSQAS